MTWLILWIALSLSLFWHYPTLQLVRCNSCLTNINFRQFAGISAHESLSKPVEPLPFCVCDESLLNKIAVVDVFSSVLQYSPSYSFSHSYSPSFLKYPKYSNEFMQLSLIFALSRRERVCVLSAVSAAMTSVSVSAYVSLIVSASVSVSASVFVCEKGCVLRRAREFIHEYIFAQVPRVR